MCEFLFNSECCGFVLLESETKLGNSHSLSLCGDIVRVK